MNAQISLDLMLAITVALIVVGTIGLVASEAMAMQAESGVRDQLDLIGNGLMTVISVSRILNDSTSARVEYDIPKLLVPGEINPQPCNIAIDTANETITLQYELYDIKTGNPKTVEVLKEFAYPEGMTIETLGPKCGETLVIIKGYDTGWLCLEDGFNSANGTSDYVKTCTGGCDQDAPAGFIVTPGFTLNGCGEEGSYYVATSGGVAGEIMVLTPPIPQPGGNFTVYFKTGIGTPGQDYEDIMFGCSNTGPWKTFEDDQETGDIYRLRSFTCDFSPGRNQIYFKSAGIDSVHIEELRIVYGG